MTLLHLHPAIIPGIDRAFFQHIIELIFHSASAESLFALRVNREWKSLAEPRLAYHIVVTSRKEPVGQYSRTVYRLRAGDRFVLGVFHDVSSFTALPPSPPYMAHTKVVDFLVPEVTPAVRVALMSCGPNVVFRCHSAPALTGGLGHLPRAACVVLFDNALVPHLDAEKLVYHCTTSKRTAYQDGLDGTGVEDAFGGGASGSWGPACIANFLWNIHNIPNCTQVTCHLVRGTRSLVVHCDAAAWLKSRAYAVPPITTPLCRHVGMFVSLILAARHRGIPTTVVGMSFEEHLPAVVPVEYADLTETMKQTIETYTVDVRSGGPGEIRYLTPEEYREEVGEEQWRIETEKGPIAYPGN